MKMMMISKLAVLEKWTWSLCKWEALQGVGRLPVGIPGIRIIFRNGIGKLKHCIESLLLNKKQMMVKPEQKQLMQPGNSGSVERNWSAWKTEIGNHVNDDIIRA